MTRRERAREDQRRRWSQIIIGLFICLLMVLSIVQFADYNNSSATGGLTFNKHTFTAVPEGFKVTVDGLEVIVDDLPLGYNGSTVEFQNLYYDRVTVRADPGVMAAVRSASFRVVAFDPLTSSPAIEYVELARFKLMQYVPNTVSAVLRNSTTYSALPLVSCADAQGGVVVIKLFSTNETSNGATLTQEGSCITVEGNPASLLAAKDYLILGSLGVIPDGP